MRNTLWTGACTAIVGAAAAVAMAQTPAPQQGSGTSSDHKITVTGCLKAAPPDAADMAGTATAGTTGTTGSAGATGTTGAATDPAGARFVLTNATLAPVASNAGATGTPAGSAAGSAAGSSAGSAAGSTAGSTASTAGSTGSQSAQSGQTYRLLANPAALSPHVGKKLELTGTLVNEPAATSGASSEGARAQGPALRVESGKVIAASCQE